MIAERTLLDLTTADADHDTPLCSGWLILRRDELELIAVGRAQFVFLAAVPEDLVRMWYVLTLDMLALYSEKQKTQMLEGVMAHIIGPPQLALKVSDIVSAAPAKGRGYYESIVHLERRDGELMHAQAQSHNEMRRLLSALNAHCIRAELDDEDDRAWPKSVVLASWLWQVRRVRPRCVPDVCPMCARCVPDVCPSAPLTSPSSHSPPRPSPHRRCRRPRRTQRRVRVSRRSTA